MRYNESELTPWFDGRLYKPARPGVYMQRLYPGSGIIGFQYWNGRLWSAWRSDPQSAFDERDFLVSHRFQKHDWRGLKEEEAS